MSQLKIDVSAGQKIGFSGSGEVVVTLLAKSGQQARLAITADKTVKIALPEKVSARQIVKQGLSKK